MEIKVQKEPVVVAELDKIKFEEEIKKSFDLRKAVMDNLVITSTSLPNGEIKLKEYVFLATDWGDVFKKYEFITEDIIELKMYKCEVRGLTMYQPGDIDPKNGSFTLSEEKITRDDFMIVTAFNPRVDKHIEYMLAQNLIDYVNFEWRLILNLD